MEFAMIIPFGGLPITSTDLGRWYPKVNRSTKIYTINLNYEFWLYLVSQEAAQLIIGKDCLETNRIDSIRIRLEAEQALNNLRNKITYSSINNYSQAIKNIENYLVFLNKSQDKLSFSILYGLMVNQIDYNESTSIQEYVQSSSLLERILHEYFKKNNVKANVILIKVRTLYELVFTAVLCKVIRRLKKDAKICLVDHEYENFTLSKLGFDNTLLMKAFDNIVLKESEFVVPLLINALKAHEAVPYLLDKKTITEHGWTSRESIEEHSGEMALAPKLKTFLPEYAISTRLSNKSCYWNKCSFCTQNNKISLVKDVISGHEQYQHILLLAQSGYRYFAFTDEAINKTDLIHFAKWVKENKLNIFWLFRTRLDCEFDHEFIKILAESGCKSIAFGLESIQAKTLKSMNKYQNLPSLDYIGDLFKKLIQSNIMVHLNLILGYPGESLSEMDRTIKYVENLLKDSALYTFTLNKFALFNDTIIHNNPHEFGIEIIPTTGDFRVIQPYRVIDEDYTDKELTNFIFQSHNKLWKNQNNSKINIGSRYLYNNTLHGIFIRLLDVLEGDNYESPIHQ